MAQAVNPYGDGRAAQRTVAALRYFFGEGERPEEFAPAAQLAEWPEEDDPGRPPLPFRERNRTHMTGLFRRTLAGVAVAARRRRARSPAPPTGHPARPTAPRPSCAPTWPPPAHRPRVRVPPRPPARPRRQTLPPGGATTTTGTESRRFALVPTVRQLRPQPPSPATGTQQTAANRGTSQGSTRRSCPAHPDHQLTVPSRRPARRLLRPCSTWRQQMTSPQDQQEGNR